MDEKLLEEHEEIPVLEITEPEEQRLAQEYIAQQDSGLLIADYQTPFASRSAVEYLTGEVPEEHRVTGGKAVYPDENSWSVLKASGCWQDFQDSLFPHVNDVTDSTAIHPRATDNQKDIFVEGSPDQKAVAMASRLTPRIYGAFVRERSPTNETYDIMRQDGVDIDEYQNRMFPFEEETGDSLWNEIIGENSYNVSPEELHEEITEQDLNLEGYGNMKYPESCIATVGRKDGKPAV